MLLDIAPSEFLLIAAVAIVCIGPKDMPRALRTAGRWMGRMRRASGHVRAGIERLIREAELEEMEREWRARNAAIMAGSSAEVPAIGHDAMHGDIGQGEAGERGVIHAMRGEAPTPEVIAAAMGPYSAEDHAAEDHAVRQGDAGRGQAAQDDAAQRVGHEGLARDRAPAPPASAHSSTPAPSAPLPAPPAPTPPR